MAQQQYQYAASGLVGIILIASLVLTAQAQGQLLNVASIIGQLCCAPNGSCDVPGALPLAGVNYTVTCTTALGSTVIVGHGTTTPSGGINATVPLPTPVLLAVASASIIIPCNVTVPLPLSSAVCPVLSATNGILTGTIQFVGTTISTLFGLIASTVVTVFFTLVIV